MEYAPIFVPTLNRFNHFYTLMESLKRNTWACYTDVIIGLDYPPNDCYFEGWKRICSYLDESDFSIFNRLLVFKRKENYGPSKNSNDLINYVMNHYGRWIYCDDDCEFAPNFLEYMNKCLDRYEDHQDVIAVTGYSYPVKWNTSDGATCMMQNFNVSTWGLGMWSKKYKEIEEYICSKRMRDNANTIIKSGLYKDMLDSTFEEYFRESLKKHSKRSVETQVTDCSLTAYLVCKQKFCISPILSKVRNLGFDGSGITCADNNKGGYTADEYDYSTQEIDTASSFVFLLNDESLLEGNKLLLNEFDYVSPEKMAIAKLNFKLISRYGMKLGYYIRMFIAGINRVKRLINKK